MKKLQILPFRWQQKKWHSETIFVTFLFVSPFCYTFVCFCECSPLRPPERIRRFVTSWDFQKAANGTARRRVPDCSGEKGKVSRQNRRPLSVSPFRIYHDSALTTAMVKQLVSKINNLVCLVVRKNRGNIFTGCNSILLAAVANLGA